MTPLSHASAESEISNWQILDYDDRDAHAPPVRRDMQTPTRRGKLAERIAHRPLSGRLMPTRRSSHQRR
jgi:hypothetical protein